MYHHHSFSFLSLTILTAGSVMVGMAVKEVEPSVEFFAVDLAYQ